MPMRLSNTQKMMLPEDPWMQTRLKQLMSALAPFPRSTWIHPHVPHDNFDRVCKVIWSRAKEAEEEYSRGRSTSQSPLDEKSSHRTEEQRTETDDLSMNTQHEEDKQQHHTEFTLPCSYLSCRRHPRVAKPTWVLSTVIVEEMKLNEEEVQKKRHSEKDKQWCVENSLKTNCVPKSRSRRDQQSSTSQQQATNPICSATEDCEPHLLNEEDPPFSSKLSRDACETVDEQNIKVSLDRKSSNDNDDSVNLPGVRSCATDSSDDDLDNDNDDCEMEEYDSCIEKSSDSEQDSQSSDVEKDFPPLSTIRDGVLPHPMKPPAKVKMHGQWEFPLSFHPHNSSTDKLACTLTTPVQEPVQGKAETPQANSKIIAPLAAPTQQESYDLLADFPALQAPRRPLALGVMHDGYPKTKDAKGKRGIIHQPNHCQETEASHQRKIKNMPHEVSSICAGDQKSVLDIQTFDSASQCNSPIISCEKLKANNQPPPRVAGTDGTGVNARSWASAAKAGMKQAAALQEKARPRSFQQIVTINRAKAVTQNTNKVTPLVITHHQGANPQLTGLSHGPQPCNPNRFFRSGYPPTYQHRGAQVHQPNCPPRIRCPRFPFQQARGNLPKHKHESQQPL